jgi:hypothetical protein
MKSATSPPPRPPPRRPVPESSGASVAEAPGEDPGQRGNKWWTLVAVCLGTFMLLLDITIVNVALPDIQRALNSSFSDLQWIVDAYALTLAAFLLTAGSLIADVSGAMFWPGIMASPLTVKISPGTVGWSLSVNPGDTTSETSNLSRAYHQSR